MGNGTKWTAEEFRRFQAGKVEAPATRKGKYGNIEVVIDGIWFQSTKEGEYYKTLKILQAAGQILEFKRQATYKLSVNGVLICKYVADFVVYWPNGTIEVIDVKGEHTAKLPVFRMKRALMKAILNIDVKIV